MFVLRGINKFLMHVEKFIVVLTGSGLVVSICVQVIGRYILQVPTPWAEEIARYLFIWMVLVGAGYVLAIKDHIEIAILDQLLEKLKNPDKAKTILFVISTIGGMVFIVLFSLIYYRYLVNINRYGGQFSAALQINMLIPMSALLVGNILMLFHSIYLLLELIFNSRSKAESAKQSNIEEMGMNYE